jgi:hypothetical protein
MEGGARKKYEHCFKIITAKRTFVVCAPSEEDEIKWLSALRVLLAASRQTGSPASKPSSPTITSAPITTISPPTPSISGVPPSSEAATLPSIEAQLGSGVSPTAPLMTRSGAVVN